MTMLMCDICQKRFKNHGGLGTHRIMHQRRGDVRKGVGAPGRSNSSQRRLLSTCALSDEEEEKEEIVQHEQQPLVDRFGYYIPDEIDEVEASDETKYDPEEGNDALEYMKLYRKIDENKEQRNYLDKSAASEAFLGYRSGGPLQRLRNLRKEVLVDAKVRCLYALSYVVAVFF